MGIAVAGALANTTIASGEVLDVVTKWPGYWLRQYDQQQYDLGERYRRPAVNRGRHRSRASIGFALTPATVMVRPGLFTVSS